MHLRAMPRILIPSRSTIAREIKSQRSGEKQPMRWELSNRPKTYLGKKLNYESTANIMIDWDG